MTPEEQAEYTYFVRTMGWNVEQILQEAGIGLTGNSRDTYCYISTETGRWVAIEKGHRSAVPMDDLGKGGFYVAHAARGQ